MALRLRQMELSVKTVHGPVLKITQFSAHAQNHVSVERYRRDESFHKVWSWYDHSLPSYSVIAADTLRDLDLWPFDLGPWSYMAGHVINPSTKFEDPAAIRSWVMSSDISHRIPLTMRLQPLRMRRITWHICTGQIFPTYLKSLTPICLFTIQLLWCYDDV